MNQDVSPMDSDAAASPHSFRAASRAKSATRRTPATQSSRPIFTDSSDSDVDLWDAPTREMFASEDLPSALRRGRASSHRRSPASGEYVPRRGMARARRRRDRDSSDATLDSDSDDPAYDSDLLDDLEKYRAALRADAFGPRSPDQALRAATARSGTGRRARRNVRATFSAPDPRDHRILPQSRHRIAARAVTVTEDARPRRRDALRAARDAAEAFAAAAREPTRPGDGDERRDAAASPRRSDDETPTSARVRTRGVEWDEDVVAFVAMDDDDRRGARTDSRRGADRTRSGADAVPTGSPTMSSTLAPSVDASATARRRHRSSVSGVDGSIATGFGADLSSSSRRAPRVGDATTAPPESFASDAAAVSTGRRKPRTRRDSTGETIVGGRRSTPGAGTSAATNGEGTGSPSGSRLLSRSGSRHRGLRLSAPLAHHSPLTFASDPAPLSFAFGGDAFASLADADGSRTRATREPRGPNEREDVDDFPADPRRDDEREGGEDEPAARLGEMAKALEHVREEVRAVSVAAARVAGAAEMSAGPSRDDGVSSPGTKTVAPDDAAKSATALAVSVRSLQNATDVLSRSVSMFRRDGSVAGDGDGGTRERIVELEATIESLRREWVDGEKVGALELAMDHAVEYLIPVGGVLIVGFTCFALAVAVIDFLDVVDHGNIETVSGDDGRMRTFLRRVLVGRLPFTFGASEDPPELVPT